VEINLDVFKAEVQAAILDAENRGFLAGVEVVQASANADLLRQRLRVVSYPCLRKLPAELVAFIVAWNTFDLDTQQRFGRVFENVIKNRQGTITDFLGEKQPWLKLSEITTLPRNLQVLVEVWPLLDDLAPILGRLVVPLVKAGFFPFQHCVKGIN
jgi:hypothetical protein